MKPRTLPLLSVFAFICLFLMPDVALGAVRSLDLVRIYTTLGGDAAQSGIFEGSSKIDLVFEFDLDSDESQTARFTWDMYDRFGENVFSNTNDQSCEPGMNAIRISDAIPNDLAPGMHTYSVYASVKIGELKKDAQFEIRINGTNPNPGLHIRDVRLTPREDDAVTSELRGAAIPYTLEIDFELNNVYARLVQIRWTGVTVEGFVLDSGTATTSEIHNGLNTYATESYIARPSSLAVPQASFIVDVIVFDQADTVSFPLETLPFSLADYISEQETAAATEFTIGEAYLTSEGIRSDIFHRLEPLAARLETGGVVPENTVVLMSLISDLDETQEDFMQRLVPGDESPVVEFRLPDIERQAGFYRFVWSVIVDDALYAERWTQITLSDERGVNIPEIIDLPGPAQLTVPLGWDVSTATEQGSIATLISPDGVVCEISATTMSQPMRAEFMADMFESDPVESGIPPGATLLTSETNELEGTWEYLRRAYLSDERVCINSYWVYKVDEDIYEFLIVSCTGTKEQVQDAYDASDRIAAGLEIGIES